MEIWIRSARLPAVELNRWNQRAHARESFPASPPRRGVSPTPSSSAWPSGWSTSLGTLAAHRAPAAEPNHRALQDATTTGIRILHRYTPHQLLRYGPGHAL